jgi:hypothetical protein
MANVTNDKFDQRAGKTIAQVASNKARPNRNTNEHYALSGATYFCIDSHMLGDCATLFPSPTQTRALSSVRLIHFRISQEYFLGVADSLEKRSASIKSCQVGGIRSQDSRSKMTMLAENLHNLHEFPRINLAV